ncbi:hypothetical protein IWQ62_003205 [Dispira parvispora]|uniref:Mitochondrial resolvase Ydc2 catalytic domain-containing protein n=1 Tax=Dispira parvispora TaxID=1520584 RepID=A0A9W8E344_9FUNG|nr:hypothetical protein IWQ62_003205 [Dispira parvispora]
MLSLKYICTRWIPANAGSSLFWRRCCHGKQSALGNPATKSLDVTSVTTRLLKLKNIALKEKLQDCGYGVSGPKAQLASRLARGLAHYQRHCQNGAPAANLDSREIVVSIDIGVRNLSFVVVDSHRHVHQWKVIDVLGDLSIPTLLQQPWQAAWLVDNLVREHLITSTAMVSHCCHITFAIERQRFRTVGFSQIPDSVLFINVLESLLYANLLHRGASVSGYVDSNNSGGGITTDFSINNSLENTFSAPTELVSVNPVTVATYFDYSELAKLAAKQVPPSRSKKPSKSLNNKLKKQLGVQLVQACLATSIQGNTTSAQNPHSMQDISLPAWEIGRRTLSPLIVPKVLQETFLNSKKKDDMADSFLQAVAWWGWQEARQKELLALDD